MVMYDITFVGTRDRRKPLATRFLQMLQRDVVLSTSTRHGCESKS